MVDQPAENWTSAYRSGGASWWHLANNRPICPDANGNPSPVVFVEDRLPIDAATSAWIDTMTALFAIDGPSTPARLGSAIAAAEYLHQWLRTASGPFSALLTLHTTADVAALLGYLHRTNRLLARVHAQTGSYLLDQARRTQFTGPDDDSDEGIDAADDIHVWLRHAADSSARSAQATGIAWSHIRTLATLTGATAATRISEQPTGGNSATGGSGTVPFLRGVVRRLRRWTSPAPTTDRGPTGPAVAQEPHQLSPDHLGELVGSAFGDEAGFSPELTRTAARILGTTASYLADCLGPARSAAIPTPHDLADLTTSLTYLTHTLMGGLRHLADSPRGSESDGLDDADATAIRASLTDAVVALRFAASHLTTVSHTATVPEQQDEEQQ
ncbi:hypothetical protein [Micromonospora sp. HUAS LYJ1]|uniref:hypothetical protein n=1 Tax=Micromonospora sp. HUAS LYJ1 TaxID=3061626 RepID=UPI00267118E3|nr:hypothetical protein [Micromonospora sp. HUAS LYJ1]WKU03433.1 hypothetical protein Q2K16_21600 [Micromonospora sp. HUAS LYJ1]